MYVWKWQVTHFLQYSSDLSSSHWQTNSCLVEPLVGQLIKQLIRSEALISVGVPLIIVGECWNRTSTKSEVKWGRESTVSLFPVILTSFPMDRQIQHWRIYCYASDNGSTFVARFCITCHGNIGHIFIYHTHTQTHLKANPAITLR